jgi:hypothetical protein
MEAIMKTRKQLSPWPRMLMIVFAALLLSVAAQAQGDAVTLHGKGHGKISSTLEERNITAVLVVLRPNGTALITLISDLQLQADADWSASKTSSAEIELKITGGELSGNWSGSGKLILSNDRKSIKGLTIKGQSFDERELTITFVADEADSFRTASINLVAWPSY